MLRCARALASDLGHDLSVAQQMLVQRASLLESNREHREIVEALKERDGQRAYQASADLTKSGEDLLKQAIEKIGSIPTA